jgi:hypothetical protein
MNNNDNLLGYDELSFLIIRIINNISFHILFHGLGSLLTVAILLRYYLDDGN